VKVDLAILRSSYVNAYESGGFTQKSGRGLGVGSGPWLGCEGFFSWIKIPGSSVFFLTLTFPQNYYKNNTFFTIENRTANYMIKHKIIEKIDC
jgi:hypothetical protein